LMAMNLSGTARKVARKKAASKPGRMAMAEGVKWGVPFYGLPGHGWITAINSFKAHVKLLFFKSGDLKPALPAGKGNNAIDFHSGEELRLSEKQVKAWLQQAKKLPGWNLKNFPGKATDL
jgi:hypothetical protein